nr:unnamed protein product [Digitaria exilis]
MTSIVVNATLRLFPLASQHGQHACPSHGRQPELARAMTTPCLPPLPCSSISCSSAQLKLACSGWCVRLSSPALLAMLAGVELGAAGSEYERPHAWATDLIGVEVGSPAAGLLGLPGRSSCSCSTGCDRGNAPMPIALSACDPVKPPIEMTWRLHEDVDGAADPDSSRTVRTAGATADALRTDTDNLGMDDSLPAPTPCQNHSAHARTPRTLTLLTLCLCVVVYISTPGLPSASQLDRKLHDDDDAPPSSTTLASVALFVVSILLAFAADEGSLAAVAQLMASCMPYLTGAPGLTPYGICCNSLGVLNQLAATRADRVAACSCIKAAAAGLPASCGPSISFAISPNMDGSQRVNMQGEGIPTFQLVPPLSCLCLVIVGWPVWPIATAPQGGTSTPGREAALQSSDACRPTSTRDPTQHGGPYREHRSDDVLHDHERSGVVAHHHGRGDSGHEQQQRDSGAPLVASHVGVVPKCRICTVPPLLELSCAAAACLSFTM